jgi:LPXTG-motif cell wall-anchored protein
MYHNAMLAGGVGAAAGTLPMTGLNLIWFILAAFALVMAAGALWRISPRPQALKR